MSKKFKESPKVLGLDVSTKTIGWALFDIQTKQLLELSHISPVPKPKEENKIKELLLKSEIFRTKLLGYKDLGITKVIIEEPLLNSNNVAIKRLLNACPTLIKTSLVVVIIDAAPPVVFQKANSPADILVGLSNLENSQVTVIKRGNVFSLSKPFTCGMSKNLSCAKPSSPP